GDLEGRRATRFGERAVGQEGAAPRGDRVAGAPGDHGGREATDGSAPVVEQAGLPGQGLAVLDDADQVAAALPDAVALDHGDVALVPEDLGEFLAQSSACRAGVELRLDHDLAADDMEAPGEAEHR